jgi:hypothetical protein
MPQDDQGRYVAPEETRAGQQVASAARTATANGTAFDTSDVDEITGSVVVTAASGTNPTLDVILQTTADGTNYYTAGSFTQKTAITAAEVKVFTGLGSLSRWKWTIGGTDTPSFTFAISATFEKD